MGMVPQHRVHTLEGVVGVPDTADFLLSHSSSDQSTHGSPVAYLGCESKRKGIYKQFTSILGRSCNFTLTKLSA